MSRFISLEINSSSRKSSISEETVSDVTLVDENVSSIEVITNKVSPSSNNLALTAENLLKMGDVSGNVTLCKEILIDPIITTARKLLFEMTKGYHKITPLTILSIQTLHGFSSYMSDKSKPYFTQLYIASEGDYQGIGVSITTWKYGKNSDGSPLYLYISACEGYGSCSFNDPVESENQFIREICYDIESMIIDVNGLNGRFNENLSVLGLEILKSRYVYKDENDRLQQISVLKTKILNEINRIREYVGSYVKRSINSLSISRSYADAVKHVIRCGNFHPPKFIDALKGAFPGRDFTNLENKIASQPKLLRGQKKNLVSDYIKM